MATTYTLISSTTIGAGGSASIEFTSIPQTYTDLVVRFSGRNTNSTSVGLTLRFNSNSSNLSTRWLLGDGSNASSSSATDMYAIAAIPLANITVNTFGNGEIYIPNYTSSNYKPSSVFSTTENNGTESFIATTANLWSNTAAITSVQLNALSGGTFAQYSTAYLYGISNA